MADDSALGRRGAALWEALHASKPLNAAELVVLEEVCRMADRLDKLDRLLRNDIDAWARIEQPHDGSSTTVVVLDDALAESRQIAATFQRLAASLNLPEAKSEAERDGIGDLAARRAARHASG